MIRNYGFDPKSIVIEPKHYVLGGAFSLPMVVLQVDKQWDAFMPTYEPQFGNGWDTDGCTIWGTQNALEFLEKRVFGTDNDHSERAVYIGTHTRPPGNDPHVIAEWIRDNGVVDQTQLPMTSTYEEFIAPDPLPATLIAQGNIWANKKYEYGHEWVFNSNIPHQDKINKMMDALQYSPLGVAVTAWFQDADGIYRDHGQPNCHWCVCFGFTDKGWKVFDSYDQSVKIYSFDSEISFCKRYHIAARAADVQRGFFTSLFKALCSIFSK